MVAKWVERDYVITLNPNGGEVKDNLINVKYEAEFTLPTPTKNGYTFLGWFYNNKEFSSGKYTEDSDIELLAKWDVKSYVIHYDGNGASNITNLNENVKYDSIINYPEPVRVGYEFLGWF